MRLRFTTLGYCTTLTFAKSALVLLLFVISLPLLSQSPSSNEDLKKQAAKLFEEENYPGAYKLYSQLVSNFPKDPVYNFRLGVCMIYAEPDKKKCIPYLKLAAAAPPEKDLKDVLFYLGKACHINYRFDDAMKHYNDYKLTASAAQIKKLEVDREILACTNGKRLLSNLTDLEVLSKSQLPESDYFRNYKKIGGKLLVKPDDFKSATDKKKKEKSVVFLPNGSSVVYFSSYGESTETGKDIYTASKQANGTYSKPQKVIGINTEFDEDYPFLHPDGKTLYFASKGFNSMGGYDIFKTVFNEETGSWGTPINLEFPINSPDDDYLFVTDSLETQAYFSTGRQSPPGKIDVLKVKTKRRPVDIIALKGKVIPGSPEHSLKSTISVKDIFTNNELGSYNSSEEGNYEMDLPNGGRVLFTVETPGLETQSAQVSLPMASAAKAYKQTISYEKGKLKILNYFDEASTESSYLDYLSVIEKKAKLDVSETKETPDTGTPPPAAATTNPTATKPDETKPETPSIPKPADTTPVAAQTGMDNKQLALLAKQDALEAKQEAAQLRRDYAAAQETGLKQKEAADKKATEASDALFKAETISDEGEKKIALDQANAMKIDAEKDQVIAAKILDLAKSLEEDAKAKDREANLNNEYARELERSLKTKDSKASLTKLESLQKQINALSQNKNASDNMIGSLKSDVEEKEKQIADAEAANTTIKTNLEEIKTLISEKETELAGTRKKAVKKELTTQIDELRLDQKEKEQQIAIKDEEIKTLNAELTAIKSELEVATKIKEENIPAQTATPPANVEITAKSLEDNYKDKITVTDPDSRSSVEESSVQLNNYNRDLDQLIAKDKATLAKTKNAAARTKLSTAIKQSETKKKQNQGLIAANNKRLQELNAAPVAKPEASPKSTYDPIVAASSSEAVSKLDNLNTQLIGNDNENFDFNGYQNPAAQTLKIEADAKINEALAKQKKLKDEIATSKDDIRKSGPAVSAEALDKEGEDLQAQAQKIRQEANGKSGPEKTKLLDEAKKLDDQANSKFIEAAEVTRSDNAAIVAVNEENIQNLISENKASEAEISQAKTLNEEAKVALKKAADIRVEGNSLSNAGGKLGSFSNAEEKEAEAILKQQQAIDLLMKSNSGFALKSAVTSTSTPEGSGSGGDLNSKLQAVNTGLSDLASVKIESYQKLNEANEAEIAQLLADIKENQSVIDNTPSLKTEFIAGNNKVENARSLKQTADNALNPNDKLSNLIACIKKQNEAMKQLSSVNTSIRQNVAKQAKQPETPVSTTQPVIDGDLPLNPDSDPAQARNEPPKGDLPLNPDEPAQPRNEPPKDPADDLAMLSELTIEKTEVSQLAQKDTTANQLVAYFDTHAPTFSNPQASESLKSSLNLLKDYEAQNAELDQALAKAQNEPSAPAAPVNSKELLTKADALSGEAEELLDDAQDLKKQAAGKKEGEERDYILAQAREVEIQGQDKMIEGANYRQQANESEYKTNSNAITELMEKLKADNPELAAEMQAKRDEYKPLKTQITNLRAEANALNNKAAKLGAISNAEEKEFELIQKQTALLNQLKKKYPDYEVKPYVGKGSEEQVAEIQQKKTELREKQYAELTNLTNAFSLEYETTKGNVPEKLNPGQQIARQNAEALNSESKRLLIQSAQEKDENEKTKLLTLAVKSGNAAVEKLNKLASKKTAAPKSGMDELEAIGNQIVSSNEEPGNKPKRTRQRDRGNRASKIKIDGLEVVEGDAYSASNPIPIDGKMEDGLIFRVQIGAFKTRLPDNAFKGLSPLNGETTSSGYIRYTAGNFVKIETANAVKNDMRSLGYSDAFVVAYFNGKRISLAEALEQMSKEGRSMDPNAPQTLSITSNLNVPKATVSTAVQENVSVTKELGKIDGLLYTIQIGVYTKQVTKPQILNLRPIFREELSNGLYRYTAGIYNNPEKLLADKDKIVDMGIRDAFVSAYLNGKRVPFAEAKERQATDANIKMEPENPIVFPERNYEPVSAPAAAPASAPGVDPLGVLVNTPVTVEPFKNSVTEYPAATPENGVKSNEEGVTFKVQIGAFSKEVPEDVAAKFSSIRSWPVDNKRINGLYIYNIGNFSEPRFAKTLRDEAIRLGITDAFIVVYRDGKKLYGPEAEALMRQ